MPIGNKHMIMVLFIDLFIQKKVMQQTSTFLKNQGFISFENLLFKNVQANHLIFLRVVCKLT